MTNRTWWGAIGSMAMAFPAFAGEPIFAPKKPSFDDAKLAMKVKERIGGDRELASANLFVSVLDGVVAVQGPVPSLATGERIKSLAAAVPGVSAVKVDCYVVPTDDPLVKAVMARVDPKPTVPVMPAPIAAATLPGLPSLAVGPVNSPSNTVVAQKPADDLPMPVMTIEPLPPAPSAPRPYPTIPTPNVPVLPVGMSSAKTGTASTEEIAFSLVDLRMSDRRFARFTASVSDGKVTVSGSGDGMADFVNQAKRITGVISVVVK